MSNNYEQDPIGCPPMSSIDAMDKEYKVYVLGFNYDMTKHQYRVAFVDESEEVWVEFTVPTRDRDLLIRAVVKEDVVFTLKGDRILEMPNARKIFSN